MEGHAAEVPKDVEKQAESVVDSTDNKESAMEVEVSEASPLVGPSNLDPEQDVAGPSNEERPAARPDHVSVSRDHQLMNGAVTPADQTAAVAAMAGRSARNAAASCRSVLGVTIEAINRGKNQVEAALQRVESEAERDAIHYYRNLAQKYATAIGNLSAEATKLESASIAADAAATHAQEAADNLMSADEQGVSEEEKKNRTQIAIWAVTSANAAAIVAFKMEFAALNGAKRYWRIIEHAEDRGSSVNRRRLVSAHEEGCTVRHENKYIKVASFITFILGCLLLVSLRFIEHRRTESEESILVLGVLLTGMPAVYFLYSIWSCYRLKQRAARASQARRMIDGIDQRLEELLDYFDNNSIGFLADQAD